MRILFLITSILFMGQVIADEKSFDREEVRLVVHKNLMSIKDCYEDGLKKNPSIKGKIILEWEIAGDGSVNKAGVKTSELRDEAVEQCMVKITMALKFPAPPPGTSVTVSYPIVFSK